MVIFSGCVEAVFAYMWRNAVCSSISPCVKAHTMLALRVLMQKNHKFEASWGYVMKPILMKKKKAAAAEEGEEEFALIVFFWGEVRHGFSV